MRADSRCVFVTGGSGFIGRHVVRGLGKQGYRVRVLARRTPKGLDPSCEVVLGDLTRPESYTAALQGVSSIVHAALTDGLSGDLQATSTLHQLGAEAGVRQFVHLSTISVYGTQPDAVVTEETSPVPATDAYSTTKLAIEEVLRSPTGCPEVAVLRLGCVYGPGGGWWTQGLLNMMASGKLILVNGGTGYANLIHVQDAVSVILLILERANSAFEIYNVTAGEPVAWSRYYAEIEKMAGHAATVSMSVAEARDHGRKWLRPSLARRVIRKVTGQPIIHPLEDTAIAGFASRAVYSNEKASRMLGFRPDYDFGRGIQSVLAERELSGNGIANGALART